MGSRELVILEEGKIRRVQDKERTARNGSCNSRKRKELTSTRQR